MIDRRQLIGFVPMLGGLASGRSYARANRLVWRFDNLETVGDQRLETIGGPTLTPSPWGPAILFDGVDDGLVVGQHPLAGANTFTFEAVFRPDGGAFEQRWFHIESGEQPPAPPGLGRTRLMFEIRVKDQSWYLDAFVSGAQGHQALIAPTKTFPIGQWYHVAQSYDGRTYRSFVNGDLQAKADIAFSPQGAGRSAVGMRMNRANYFHGAVRVARFSRHALGPSRFLRMTDF